MSTTTPESAYSCPHVIADPAPRVCGLPTRVFRSEQRPLGRYRRRTCEVGHRCTTVERAIAGGTADVGAVLEQAAYSVDTLRDLLSDARRLVGGPLPPRYASTRNQLHTAAQNAAQEV